MCAMSREAGVSTHRGTGSLNVTLLCLLCTLGHFPSPNPCGPATHAQPHTATLQTLPICERLPSRRGGRAARLESSTHGMVRELVACTNKALCGLGGTGGSCHSLGPPTVEPHWPGPACPQECGGFHHSRPCTVYPQSPTGWQPARATRAPSPGGQSPLGASQAAPPMPSPVQCCPQPTLCTQDNLQARGWSGRAAGGPIHHAHPSPPMATQPHPCCADLGLRQSWDLELCAARPL